MSEIAEELRTKPVLVVAQGSEMMGLPVVRSLGRQGIKVDLAAVNPATLVRHSRYVQTFIPMDDPSHNVSRWLDWYRSTATDKYAAVLPVSDRSLVPLHNHRHELPDTPPRLMVGDPEYQLSYDKAETVKVATALGIPCPKTYTAHAIDELDAAVDYFDGKFPLLLKPARSKYEHEDRIYSVGVKLAQNREELATFAQPLLALGPLLIQEFLKGWEVAQAFLLNRGELIAAVQHRQMHEALTGLGPGTYRRADKVTQEIAEQSLSLLRSVAWHGIGQLDYLMTKEGKHYLLEINGRWWGSLPIFVALGVDLPWLWLSMEFGAQPQPCNSYRASVYGRNLQRDVRWIKANLRANHRDPSLKTVPRLRVLGELAHMLTGRERWDEVTLDDPNPGFKLVQGWCGSAMRKILGRSG